MEIPHYADGTENLYEAHVVSDAETSETVRRVRVRAVRLDELCGTETAPVRFIKMDVEGHEGEVIEGARNLLKHVRPALFIEISGDPDDTNSRAARVFEDLGAMDYQAFLWDGQALKPRKSGDFSVDYFFLQPLHREQLRAFCAHNQ
ncbi:MAG: FkbM family methyltransferase [Planctomycetaceae bacterium]|nr:MAG: FkbM family methyltransferase [Planctomycetaceae bacterium]